MKVKNTQNKNQRRWFNVLTTDLKKRIIEYNSLRIQRKNRMETLKLGDHLLRDLGFENLDHEKRPQRK